MSNNVLKKIEKVKNYILEKRADAALLRKKSNFSWLTGGKTNRIVNESDIGNAGILVTKNGCFIVTDNIEEPRIYSEEVSDNIFNKIIFKWFEPWNQYDYIVKKVGSNNILSDTLFKDFRPMGEDFDKLKYILDNEEKKIIAELGEVVSKIVTKVCNETKKNESEFNCQALLYKYLLDKGIIPTVSFAASDERIFNFRHPITTFKKINKYFIVIICAEYKGLIVSLSRAAHFGKLPIEIEEKKTKLAQLDAEIINYTGPGKTYADVFRFIKKLYTQYGYENEWIYHLQGGPIGYSARYFLADEHTEVPVEIGHAFAWNPTIKGTKSEDTFLVEKDINKYLTYDSNWPSIEEKIDGKIIIRPDILIK
ncbi:MAG: aminopeptidase P family protein [Actinobacteria bacterium]|nr:aminopeptidase P family protein [Actinomycetota bacterium]